MAAWLLCQYGTKALSTLMRFRFHKWFRCARPFVHTNTPSVFIESASICWKRSWKWIKTKMRIHAYRISVDGRKPIKIKTMTENITGVCVCSMRIEFNYRHNVQFYRFIWKRIETVVWTRINWCDLKNVYLWKRIVLWTGPTTVLLTKNRQKEKNDWLCFGSYFQQMKPITVSQCFFFLSNDKPLLF